jgi:hypothetical protein
VDFIFNKPLFRILQDIKDEKFFKRPRPMLGDSTKRPQDKHCEYHEDVGHKTNDCILLKKHLDDLVKEGHLQQYLKNDKKKGNADPQRPNKGQKRKPRGIPLTPSMGFSIENKHPEVPHEQVWQM